MGSPTGPREALRPGHAHQGLAYSRIGPADERIYARRPERWTLARRVRGPARRDAVLYPPG